MLRFFLASAVLAAAASCGGRLSDVDNFLDGAASPPFALDATARSPADSADAAPRLRVDAPKFSVPAGTYDGAQTVAISSSTPGATIYYTVNGTDPNASSNEYKGPLSVASNLTLRAIAIASGYDSSTITSATYTIFEEGQAAATPFITPPGGMYSTPVQVSITTTESQGTIVFTLDASLPSITNGTKYTSPFAIVGDVTVIAVTIHPYKSDSQFAYATYTGELTPVASPVAFGTPEGTYTSPFAVVMSTTTQGATICYTIDGNTPTCDNTKPLDQMCTGTSARYKAVSPPVVVKATLMKAIACKAGSTTSAVSTVVYQLK